MLVLSRYAVTVSETVRELIIDCESEIQGYITLKNKLKLNINLY